VKKYRLNTKERANGKTARDYSQNRTENETWKDPKFDAKISLKSLWTFGTKLENRYWGKGEEIFKTNSSVRMWIGFI